MEGALKNGGETVTIAGTDVLAFVSTPPDADLSAYLDATELTSAGRPVWFVFVGLSASVTAGDAVTRGGFSSTVRKVIPLKAFDTTFGSLAICW
jgi:hypothetical protein